MDDVIAKDEHMVWLYFALPIRLSSVQAEKYIRDNAYGLARVFEQEKEKHGRQSEIECVTGFLQ